MSKEDADSEETETDINVQVDPSVDSSRAAGPDTTVMQRGESTLTRPAPSVPADAEPSTLEPRMSVRGLVGPGSGSDDAPTAPRGFSNARFKALVSAGGATAPSPSSESDVDEDDDERTTRQFDSRGLLESLSIDSSREYTSPRPAAGQPAVPSSPVRAPAPSVAVMTPSEPFRITARTGAGATGVRAKADPEDAEEDEEDEETVTRGRVLDDAQLDVVASSGPADTARDEAIPRHVSSSELHTDPDILAPDIEPEQTETEITKRSEKDAVIAKLRADERAIALLKVTGDPGENKGATRRIVVTPQAMEVIKHGLAEAARGRPLSTTAPLPARAAVSGSTSGVVVSAGPGSDAVNGPRPAADPTFPPGQMLGPPPPMAETRPPAAALATLQTERVRTRRGPRLALLLLLGLASGAVVAGAITLRGSSGLGTRIFGASEVPSAATSVGPSAGIAPSSSSSSSSSSAPAASTTEAAGSSSSAALDPSASASAASSSSSSAAAASASRGKDRGPRPPRGGPKPASSSPKPSRL